MPHPIAPRFADVNGIRLAYADRGKGRLVILLHGFPDTASTWDGMVDALVANGYRAVTVNMRGYPPSSPAPDGKYSVRRLAGDVLGLMDVLKVERAFIVGHDWGAFAAYAAATIAPDRIAGLVTEGLPPIAVYNQGLRETLARPHHLYLRLHGLSAWLVRRRNFRQVDHLYKTWAPHFKPSKPHLAAVKTSLAPKGRARAAIEYYTAPMTKGDKAQFKQPLSVPGLIFYGYDEPRTRREMFRRAQEGYSLPLKTVVMPNVGHWPHLEKREQFQEETIAFLNSIISPGSSEKTEALNLPRKPA